MEEYETLIEGDMSPEQCIEILRANGVMNLHIIKIIREKFDLPLMTARTLVEASENSAH